jgi:L-alanine-DL-glutamate epimerase-like enolase superfamily enzyme
VALDETELGPTISSVRASLFVVPTDRPESDGTLEWDKTGLVVVEVVAGGTTGLGYSYADGATATLVREKLAEVVVGRGAFEIPALHARMVQSIRNLGRAGVASMAISAVDTALWDAKAKLHGVALVTLLGRARASVPAYGSGGFTSYSLAQLAEQVETWSAAGFRLTKIKVGRVPQDDPERVQIATQKLGPGKQLFVDANGAYRRKEALVLADEFAARGVTWFEEPVSSDDLEGLRLLRDRAPAGMAIAAGEYGYEPFYFRRMLDAGAVDILQADATRCGGVTGFLAAHALCDAVGVPLSSHCAPALHAPLACALTRVCHVEYFHDHQRIERMLFDGAPEPVDGTLAPDGRRPGLGLELKRQDAQRYAT